MAEHSILKLDPDSHLLLERPLLRLPHELLKKTLKSAQRAIEPVNKQTTTAIQASTSQTPAQTLASLDATLQKAQNLKRKLEALHAEEKALHAQQKARIEHLQTLHEIPSLGDVAYDRWSHDLTQSAKELAEENNLGGLVDIGVFEEAGRIRMALLGGDVREALNWCAENKNALKKIGSELELELRLQQFIELTRCGDTDKLMEAIGHARKHLAGDQSSKFGLRAGGLMVYPPDTFVEPYQTLYSRDRYDELSTMFVHTHQELFSLPPIPLLQIALSAGLSALKTPACHSQHALAVTANTGAPVCPICSTELNELAKSVPYAHHTTSSMEDDPVMLPNGRVFGRERLQLLNEKLGVRKGRYRDPTKLGEQDDEWDESKVRKVFIS
ncbi:hypothetical protein Q7P36_005872 [Cladosporium allicinum]